MVVGLMEVLVCVCLKVVLVASLYIQDIIQEDKVCRELEYMVVAIQLPSSSLVCVLVFIPLQFDSDPIFTQFASIMCTYTSLNLF